MSILYQTCTIVTSLNAVLLMPSILFGGDMINLIDSGFWVTPDLYCIYVFIKQFYHVFIRGFSFYDESEALPVDLIWIGRICIL